MDPGGQLTEAAADAAIVSAATTPCLPTEIDDPTERHRFHRIKEARFPRLKHLDDFLIQLVAM